MSQFPDAEIDTVAKADEFIPETKIARGTSIVRTDVHILTIGLVTVYIKDVLKSPLFELIPSPPDSQMMTVLVHAVSACFVFCSGLSISDFQSQFIQLWLSPRIDVVNGHIIHNFEILDYFI